MGWDDVTKIVAAISPLVIGVVSVVVNQRSSRGRRARLRQDAELLALLPEGSEARRLLESHIERTVVQLGADDEKRRDPFGIVLALVFLAFSGWTGSAALRGSNRWLLLAIPCGVLGLAGVARDGSRAKRDWRGRPVP